MCSKQDSNLPGLSNTQNGLYFQVWRHKTNNIDYLYIDSYNYPSELEATRTGNIYRFERGPTQAELGPPENSQLAPPGQAPLEVVGVSNENLASVQAQQQTPEVVQQEQTGGKRRRRKNARK